MCSSNKELLGEVFFLPGLQCLVGTQHDKSKRLFFFTARAPQIDKLVYKYAKLWFMADISIWFYGFIKPTNKTAEPFLHYL